MIGDWIALLVILAIPAAIAFAGTTLLLRRTRFAMLGGVALLLVAGLVPLLLAYAYWLGVIAAGVGPLAAAAWHWRRLATPGWALAAAALVVVVGEQLLIFTVLTVQADERFSRCAGDMAIAAVAKSVAQGRGYPENMPEVAAFDGEYGECYVTNNVNWLYRVSAPGTYTLGYWVDWHVTRHVCLHKAQTQGWTCGFEMWGPFKPGEVDWPSR